MREDKIEDESTTSKCLTKLTQAPTPGICTIPDFNGQCVKTSVIQPPSNKTSWMMNPPIESLIKTEQTEIKSEPPINTTLDEMYHDYVGNQDPRNRNEVSVIVSDKRFTSGPKIQNHALMEAHNLLETNSFNRILEDFSPFHQTSLVTFLAINI